MNTHCDKLSHERERDIICQPTAYLNKISIITTYLICNHQNINETDYYMLLTLTYLLEVASIVDRFRWRLPLEEGWAPGLMSEVLVEPSVEVATTGGFGIP